MLNSQRLKKMNGQTRNAWQNPKTATKTHTHTHKIIHFVPVPLQDLQTLASRDLPNSHRPVFSPRRHARAVVADVEATDLAAVMRLHFQHHLAGHGARDLDRAVVARRGNAVAGLARAPEKADGTDGPCVLLDLKLAGVEVLGLAYPLHDSRRGALQLQLLQQPSRLNAQGVLIGLLEAHLQSKERRLLLEVL